MILTARDISFHYPCGKRQVLDNFSLELASGQRLGLAAPSGFGKTTLCKILAGYEQPSSGAVLLDGRPLDSWGRYCPVQLIWQHPEQVLNPRLKLGQSLGQSSCPPERRLLDQLGVEPEWLQRYPAELSAGEQQRFCIARALGEQTRFLLADEISAMLDLITQAQLWRFLLAETERRQIGLLIVSHDDFLLARLCPPSGIIRLQPPPPAAP